MTTTAWLALYLAPGFARLAWETSRRRSALRDQIAEAGELPLTIAERLSLALILAMILAFWVGVWPICLLVDYAAPAFRRWFG